MINKGFFPWASMERGDCTFGQCKYMGCLLPKGKDCSSTVGT